MAVTVSSFLARYPEFEEIKCKHRELVEAVLAEASRQISVDNAGSGADDAILALAAQKLARSACGRDAGLVDKKTGATAYDAEVAANTRRFGLSIRVL